MKKYHKGYVQGTFDLFHVGHLNLLRRAKERCDYLLVGVVSDELNEVYKGVSPFVPYQERSEVVAGCRYVDEVIKIDVGHDDKLKIWEEHHFDCHFCGDDHGGWEGLIDELHKRDSEVEFFPYTETTSSTRIKEELKKRLLYHQDDVMSFDVFDTLVTRKVATPRGIFALIQQRLADESVLPKLPLRVRKGFYDMRWYYERKARKLWQSDSREEITFNDIYKCFGDAEMLSDAQLKGLMKLELEIEAQNLVGIVENIQQVKDLLASDHRVILISDMYLREKELRSLLVTVDAVFGELPIYSSADMLKAKWSGNSFKQVRLREGLDIFRWVHTGDNKASDIERARELGIKTIFYNGTALTRRESELMNRHEDDVHLQLEVGALRMRRLAGEDVSLDALDDKIDEADVPFGLANSYPVGVLADRIALYGAGHFGRDLYAKLQEYGKYVVCWVDKQAERLQSQGMPVESPQRLEKGDFEQVVVGVKAPEKVREIKDDLVTMGIIKEKIFLFDY
ncbi:adenylyltransferase/cytidyltransferase family protein [uncultured Anaerovibrio sp.]|uniref:adenylyltransferase/cytidyltransferase family protein n=1 Tax=uncultured Anaerovibrio sp. TaxID=361586 RepID=UPI002607A978|nr:adenylyltransferase/cytidyltransferase family protein [uncultured Anaerovibrio sp.]